LDVVAFANLAQIYFIDKEVSYALRDFMGESCANLVGLVNRMKDRSVFVALILWSVLKQKYSLFIPYLPIM
jgi:hypothetical protein